MGFLDSCRSQSADASGRTLWEGRVAFILAAIGSAVGLGNVWRFPALSYAHGGGAFLVPYLLALFFIGIPLLILEFSLGQVFRSGDIVAFGSISKRMRGIGLTSVFSAFMIVCFYTSIIAWSLVFLVNSFRDPLPWTVDFLTEELETSYLKGLVSFQTAEEIAMGSAQAVMAGLLTADTDACTGVSTARNMTDLDVGSSFFFNDILRLGLTPGQEGGGSISTFGGSMVVTTMVGMLFTWTVIFVSIYRGPQFTSRVVYFTMPIPVITIIILLIVGLSLDTEGKGTKAYIGEWDFDKLEARGWSEAVGQIFFSIGVTFGMMTAYASYNMPNQNTVQDALIVSLSNSLVSFIAGFAVFGILGRLATDQGVEIEDLSVGGVSLVFVSVPIGLAKVSGGGFLCFLFFLTLFFLGIDSAFSLVEAVSTALHDSRDFGSKYTRPQITVVLTLVAVFIGQVYAAASGLYVLDAVDYYINNITMMFVGFFECYAVGWMMDLGPQVAAIGWAPIIVLNVAFFLPALLGPLIAMIHWSSEQACKCAAEGNAGMCMVMGNSCFTDGLCIDKVNGDCPTGSTVCRVGNEWKTGLIIALIVWFVFTVIAAVLAVMSKPSAADKGKSKLWWLFLANPEGARGMINEILLTTPGNWAVPMVWGLLVKFFIPPVLVILTTITVVSNIHEPYGGYPGSYTAAGVCVALFGVFMSLYVMVYPDTILGLMPEGHEVIDTSAAMAALGKSKRGIGSSKSSKKKSAEDEDDEEEEEEEDSEEDEDSD